ncbi:hypothetical protein SCA6_010200 [Theobroma cacao]
MKEIEETISEMRFVLSPKCYPKATNFEGGDLRYPSSVGDDNGDENKGGGRHNQQYQVGKIIVQKMFGSERAL